MRVVIVGYGQMLQALVDGVMESNHDLAGVFRHENVVYGKFKRFLYDLMFPSNDYLLVKHFYIYDIHAKGVNSNQFRKELKKLKADIVIVGSWSEKFEKETIGTPALACINVHPSLLPKYRGANPYFQVIMHDEKITGVTFHLMNEKFDSGDILEQIQVPISKNETGKSLKYKCTKAVQENIANFLDNISEKMEKRTKQNENLANYQKQITIRESIIDFRKENSEEIDRRIRALTPWMNCYFPYKNEFFKFKEHKIINQKSDKTAGTIISKTKDSISIACLDGKIIEFYNIKIIRKFSKIFSPIYIKYFIKINSRAI